MMLESMVFAGGIFLVAGIILCSLYLLCRHTRPSLDGKHPKKIMMSNLQ
jgi:hypothetical protein